MSDLQLLFLHGLPLNAEMWSGQRGILPGAEHAPTLYRLGHTVPEWASALLQQVQGDRLVVVGHSVGGSCAVEMALAAPDRIAALVLIGTKAGHRPDAALRDGVLQTLREGRIEDAWMRYWSPLFSPAVRDSVKDRARAIALQQSSQDLARGVAAFHSRPARDAQLGSLTCPVHFVTGDADPAPGVDSCRAQCRKVAQGQLHVVPSCGHYVPLEQPQFLRTLLRGLVRSVQQGTAGGLDPHAMPRIGQAPFRKGQPLS